MRTQPRRRRFPHASSVALATTAAALLLGAASAAEDRFKPAAPSVVRPLTVGAVLADDETTGRTVLYEAFEAIAALEVPFVINNFGETLFMQRFLAALAVRPKSTARSSGRRATRMTTDRRARIGR